ncbi:organic cation transporter protein-like [Anticarsia gemmatalis]|uniref:organic cation transporter protein-like n=1 Tax=Anticarsia gemmatalis TaxID=129554 RepID=UPI003F773FF9
MSKIEELKVKGDVEADPHKVDLDTILENEIGNFGKFQLRTMIVTVIASAMLSWGATEYVFTTARISTRCLIPECDGDQPEWSPYWLSNAVPVSSTGSVDNCQRFGNVSALSRLVESDTCPSTLFDTDTRLPCDEYVYENTHSVAYDLGMACDEWRRSLIGTIRLIGSMIAAPLAGFASDRWGRRVALSLCAFNTGWLGILRYWSNTYFGFVFSEFIEAVAGAGGFASLYILFTEFVGSRYRVAAVATVTSSFSVGQVLMGLIAWAVPNWRHLTLVLYFPQLFTLSYFWFAPESVRWYMSKGRFEESEALLKKVAKVNGRTLSDKSLEVLRRSAEEEAKNRAIEAERKSAEPWLIVQVFRHKQILLRCMVTPVWWITSTFIYYSLSVNSVNLTGNRYLNFVAVSLVEIPGGWTAVYLLGKIGRKPVLIGCYWVCAACQITYIFTSKDMITVSLIVYLISKYTIALAMTSLYVYTAELYPTKRRHSLFAFSSMLGKIGSMTAPLTPAIGHQWFEELPFLMFASFALLSGALVFLTPETQGTKLPETFEDAENIGRKNKKTAKI